MTWPMSPGLAQRPPTRGLLVDDQRVKFQVSAARRVNRASKRHQPGSPPHFQTRSGLDPAQGPGPQDHPRGRAAEVGRLSVEVDLLEDLAAHGERVARDDDALLDVQISVR